MTQYRVVTDKKEKEDEVVEVFVEVRPAACEGWVRLYIDDVHVLSLDVSDGYVQNWTHTSGRERGLPFNSLRWQG